MRMKSLLKTYFNGFITKTAIISKHQNNKRTSKDTCQRRDIVADLLLMIIYIAGDSKPLTMLNNNIMFGA